MLLIAPTTAKNGPEYDHQSNESLSSKFPQSALRLGDLQVLPNDLALRSGNGSSIKLRRLLRGHPSIRSFGSLLSVEFNEDTPQKFALKFTMRKLGHLYLWYKSLQLSSCPFDCVNLLAGQWGLAQSVCWAVLLLEPL